MWFCLSHITATKNAALDMWSMVQCCAVVYFPNNSFDLLVTSFFPHFPAISLHPLLVIKGVPQSSILAPISFSFTEIASESDASVFPYADVTVLYSPRPILDSATDTPDELPHYLKSLHFTCIHFKIWVMCKRKSKQLHLCFIYCDKNPWWNTSSSCWIMYIKYVVSVLLLFMLQSSSSLYHNHSLPSYFTCLTASTNAPPVK